jgi:hypothetical protein
MIWRLDDAIALRLLDVVDGSWFEFCGQQGQFALTQDQLLRISALVGLYTVLRKLFADDMAERWVQLPNKGDLFDGKTPVEVMADGGLSAMLEVCNHVEQMAGPMALID